MGNTAIKIHQIDPETGAFSPSSQPLRHRRDLGRWRLWHGTWEGDERYPPRRPETGAVLERLEMPSGVKVGGMESEGANLFYCGGGSTGKVRAVRRPKGEK